MRVFHVELDGSVRGIFLPTPKDVGGSVLESAAGCTIAAGAAATRLVCWLPEGDEKYVRPCVGKKKSQFVREARK